MFCPKCSQQQTSDETSFCSRCGFQLNVVKAILSSDDSVQTAEIKKPDRSLRPRDMTIGAALMFLFAFIVTVLTSGLPASDGARILLVVVAWLIVSLLINIKPLIQKILRADNSAAKTDDFSPAKVISRFTSKDKKALTEAHSVPAADFVVPGAKTAEMVPPPSITEPTTNLLDKQ